MDIKEIMSIDVNNLKQKQFETMKKHILLKIKQVEDLIKANKFEELQTELVFSPSGDAHGTDSHHVNFAYDDNSDETLDLDDVLEILISLKR